MVGTKEYFSKWFDIIPKHDAKMLWENGNRNFLVLASDGSDRYADNFGNNYLIDDVIITEME